MEDEILSITERPVPRIGPTAAEQHWLWSAVRPAVCPLVFLPRYIWQGDGVAVGMWALVLVAGVMRSRHPVLLPSTVLRMVLMAAFVLSGVLVFVVENPIWRATGLALALIAVAIDFALAKPVANKG